LGFVKSLREHYESKADEALTRRGTAKKAPPAACHQDEMPAAFFIPASGAARNAGTGDLCNLFFYLTFFKKTLLIHVVDNQRAQRHASLANLRAIF